MDYSLLKGNVTENHTYEFMGINYQRGMLRCLRGTYTHYLLLGEIRSLSTWLFCVLARIFYPKRKVYFWTHGWYGKESYLDSLIKKIFLKLPNGGIFLYGYYARQLMLKKGFDADKLYVIHNSLSYDRQVEIRKELSRTEVFYKHFKNNNPNLIFVGRLTKVKHLDMILNAMKHLEASGKHYNLTFIGAGEDYDKLNNHTFELGLTNNVWFYGACYDECQLGQLIYNADLCVSPGNVGLTAMHSMAFGTPVLTHNDFAWQMPEFEAIQEGITGGFFERGSVDSLAKAIYEWFNTPGYNREQIRRDCFLEIDRNWTPQFQLQVLKMYL